MLDTVLSPVSNGDYYMNYLTVYQNAEASFIEKRSEFIGYIAPVSTNEEAVNFINSIRSKHRKAKHNVYAYILRQDNISRYSDQDVTQGGVSNSFPAAPLLAPRTTPFSLGSRPPAWTATGFSRSVGGG